MVKVIKEKVPTESLEAQWLIRWVKLKKLPVAHIANEGKRSLSQGRLLKAQGLSKGFPDFFLPIVNKNFHGLFIELKRRKGSVTTKEQIFWLSLLNNAGYCASLCKGWNEARKLIEWYISDDDRPFL